MYEKKKHEFSNKFQQITNAEATLRAHSINKKEQIDSIKQEISNQKSNHGQI